VLAGSDKRSGFVKAVKHSFFGIGSGSSPVSDTFGVQIVVVVVYVACRIPLNVFDNMFHPVYDLRCVSS
jgi:hypothetical protein